MIKTLRITSIVAAGIAAVFVVLLAIFALRGDGEMKDFLARLSAIEKFRGLAKKAPASVEKVSPLITQARAFALKLNPPKPKVIKKPTTKKQPSKITKQKPAIPTPKAVVSAKFKLVGTCKYAKDPEKSLALLDLTAKGQKWYRQGQQVGHLTIHQIDEDSIILYKGGAFNSEISVQRVKATTKPLLKSDAELLGLQTESVERGLFEVDEVVLDATPDRAPAAEAADKKMSRREALKQSRRAGRTRSPAASAAEPVKKRIRRQAPQQTPAQRKKAAEDSISQIKSIMNRNAQGSDGSDDSEKENWERLLKTLEEDSANIDKEAAAGRVEKNKSTKKTK